MNDISQEMWAALIKASCTHTETERADNRRLLDVLVRGTIADLENCERSFSHFPFGTTTCGGLWIDEAICGGSILSIQWLITRGGDLGYRDGAGCTALLSAIDRKSNDKYEVMDLLLKSGAPHDLHGINDWTAVHLAAIRNDVKALEVLRRHGADPMATREDFSISTPLKDAMRGKNQLAIEYLQEWIATG